MSPSSGTSSIRRTTPPPPSRRRAGRSLALIASIALGCAGEQGVVRVAPPTGEQAADLASLRAALDSVRPGGTVQFAAGTYAIGSSGTAVPTSDIALAGHADGTVLRGCAPDSIATMSEDRFFGGCNGVLLTGARQVVRDLSFEHFATAIGIAGASDSTNPMWAANREGGHRIQASTFRNSVTIEVHADADSAIVFQGNTFRNTYHAVAISGRNVHVLENDIAAPEPQNVPFGWPSLAIGLRPHPGAPCTGLRIEGNRIEGHTDAVILGVLPPDGPGAQCSGNSIRNNEITMRPVVHSKDAGPLAGKPAIGVAIRLINLQTPIAAGLIPSRMPAPPGGFPAEFARASLHDNVIEGNRVTGAKGVAIELIFASGNRVVNNRIAAVTPLTAEERAVFSSSQTFGIGPGFWLTTGGWPAANGSTVYVTPDSARNTVTGNGAEGTP